MAKKKSGGLRPGKHHGFYVLIMVTGWLVPPLAVLLRFGIGVDFFINIVMTILGYIPGHVHNFYLQNIRNNRGRGRTPKWAIKYGLVKEEKVKDSERQWSHRYGERNPYNTYEEGDRELDDGDFSTAIPKPYVPVQQPQAGFGADGNEEVPTNRDALPLDIGPMEEERPRPAKRGSRRAERYGLASDHQDLKPQKSKSKLGGMFGGKKEGDRFERMERERTRRGYQAPPPDDPDGLNHTF